VIGLEQVKSLWNGLSIAQRVTLGAVTAVVFAGVLLIARVAASPTMVLLYGGLDPRAAGDIVAALDQRGVGYEVRGDSLFVPVTQRDELRMTLAGEGLPATGTQGYELLDGLSGFGTTSQMFDAAYWRAKEGELARTIVASPQIRAARVHIAQSAQTAFRRDFPPTASVTVTPAQGGISATHARALRFLVASAVPGLEADGVSIIDTAGNMIGNESEGEMGAPGTDRAEELRRNVLRLVEAHVGRGKAVVELSVDIVTERESLIERRFDPTGRVAISSDTEERSTESNDTGATGVSVASNLPDGDAAGDGRSESRNVETRERINYEVSEIQREVQRSPGAIRRITVAVLIDALPVAAPETGAPTWAPRPDAEIAALRDLVASAIGFDEARGDVITLRVLPFPEATLDGAEAVSGKLDLRGLDPMALVQLGVLAVVVLLLGLFVLRPLLLARRADGPLRELALAGAPIALGAPGGLAGASGDGTPFIAARGLPAPGASADRAEDVTIDTPGSASEDPVVRLRRLIEARQEESIEILRGWMEEGEERA
jgi:flagellar M-ring protein FliF